MKIKPMAELSALIDKKIFHEVGEAADCLSLPAYVVGGYVREIGRAHV